LNLNNYQDQANFLKALSHPLRLMIVAELMGKERCVSNIEQLVKVKQSNLSQHLRLLKLYGIVGCRRQGNKKCYFITKKSRIKKILEVFSINTARRK
jgi:ArsR family transcriptional regulator